MTEITGETSDGYHTFNELYAHRRALTGALFTAIAEYESHLCWRSLKHCEGSDEMYEGYFIVGIDLPTGTVTYHYPIEAWDEFSWGRTLERAPKWDGASADEVLKRLTAFAKNGWMCS